MGLNTKVQIKKTCRMAWGDDGAFDKAIDFLKKQYVFFVKHCPEKTIEIKMEVADSE